MTTVMGRVRATVRLKSDGGEAPRVLETSWATDRPFPRTSGVAVAFELEASDGQIYRVEPFEALVALPVRATQAHDGVRREQAWIAAHDEITVDGEVEHAVRASLPVLRARRIVMAGTTTPHLLPPRTLQRGESEKVDEVAAAAPVFEGASAAATDVAPDVATEAAKTAAAGEGVTGPAVGPDSGAPPLPPRRPKKKRPDSSGTPPPVQ